MTLFKDELSEKEALMTERYMHFRINGLIIALPFQKGKGTLPTYWVNGRF
jgi:hypothetical protein